MDFRLGFQPRQNEARMNAPSLPLRNDEAGVVASISKSGRNFRSTQKQFGDRCAE
jgi:hypothetical protein